MSNAWPISRLCPIDVVGSCRNFVCRVTALCALVVPVLAPVLLLLAMFSPGAHAQESFETLAAEIEKHVSGRPQKTLDELIVLGKRYVSAARTRYGERSEAHAVALNALARFHFWARQQSDADQLFRAELAIRESAETVRNAAELLQRAEQLVGAGKTLNAFPYALGAVSAAESQLAGLAKN
jgi:hypothetical protein